MQWEAKRVCVEWPVWRSCVCGQAWEEHSVPPYEGRAAWEAGKGSAGRKVDVEVWHVQ